MIALKNPLEEGGTSREDQTVGLNLFVLAGQGDVEQVAVLSQVTKGSLDILVEITPTEALLLRCQGK